MAKRMKVAPSKTRDLGSGGFGFGRQNSAATAVKIGGSQGSGGMKAPARRVDSAGKYSGGQCHRVGSKGGGY